MTQRKQNDARKYAVLALALLAVVLVLVILWSPIPRWLRPCRASGLFDCGHFVLLAALTGYLWWTWRNVWPAVCVAVAIAGVAEGGQSFLGRSADMTDFFRGLFGSLIVLVLAYGVKKPKSKRRMRVCLVLLVALAVWPVVEFVPILPDIYVAYRSFPVVSDFEFPWHVRRWSVPIGRLTRVREPEEPTGQWVGRLESSDHEGMLRACLLPIVYDWREYRHLCFEFSLSEGPVDLWISIRTGRFKQAYNREYTVSLSTAGQHLVRLDLRSPDPADPTAPPLDLSYVCSLHLAANGLDRSQKILIRRIYVE